MPAPNPEMITSLPALRVELEPVQNAMNSLLLIQHADKHSGYADWVLRTRAALPPDRLERHELVMIGFYYAVAPEQSWNSFPEYLDYLEQVPPTVLRDKLMLAYASMPSCDPPDQPAVNLSEENTAAIAEALTSSEAYIQFLRQRFEEKYIDVALETEAYRYAADPAAMQKVIVSHLRFMWEAHLSEEWKQVTPILSDAVRAFHQLDLSKMSRLEAARLVTGHEMNEEHWPAVLERAAQVVFIPNAHIGPYVWKCKQGDTLCLVFGARLPREAHMVAPDLSRAEIIVRLNALADDNRLKILHFIAENGEQRAQDLITQLDLSQSAASRHLQQLSATGYLSERRCEGGKCYRLNTDRIHDTLQALSGFLHLPVQNPWLSEPAIQARSRRQVRN